VRRLGLALALLAPGCREAATSIDAHGVHRTTVRVGKAVFDAEVAGTVAEQAKGMMFRTNLPPGAAMLFWPYPAAVDGKAKPPQVANFWMKDTPSPLDIIFIRADGTIARIAENAVPFDETPLSSGEPVAAVLEIRGGRAAELGVGEGDRVTWAER